MDARDVPGELTLCRVLIAVTDILDVPRAFLEEAFAHSRSLQLRYDFLGRREVFCLDNPALARGGATKTRGKDAEGRAEGKRGKEQLSRWPRHEELVRVPVKSFRSDFVRC